MFKSEYEKKKKELRERINAAQEEAELDKMELELRNLEEEEVVDDPITEDETNIEEKTPSEEEERKLVKETEKIEKRKKEILVRAKEERKMEEKEELNVLEKRGADLKDGKAIKVPLEERSTTVSGGELLVPKKYKNSIDESFEAVSGLIDRVDAIQLDGGDSYSVAFEKSYGEGDYTGENANYEETDPEFDYVDTGRAKITAYSEISREAIKLPNVNYQAFVARRVRDAIRKKIAKQIIVGAGTTNTIKGIYNADTKVLPTDSNTADIYIDAIDIDTLTNLVFAYGGDESVEGEAVVILSKKDLEAFAKVKTSDDKFVYKVTRKGQTGTIGYENGGLTVDYVINSAANSLSNTELPDETFTMVYGPLSSFEMPVFSQLEIEESRDFNFKKGMIAYRGDVIVGGTVKKYKGFVRVKKGTAPTPSL